MHSIFKQQFEVHNVPTHIEAAFYFALYLYCLYNLLFYDIHKTCRCSLSISGLCDDISIKRFIEILK